MTMAGRITPIFLGFWDTAGFASRIVAKSYPAPATFSWGQEDRFHGF
jgi:hypothetical protein